jgi:hypothetical protein
MLAVLITLGLALITTLAIGQSLSPDQGTFLAFTTTILSTIAFAIIIRLAWTRKLYDNEKSLDKLQYKESKPE